MINPRKLIPVRDATVEDLNRVKSRVKYHTKTFFGNVDLKVKFFSSPHSLIIEYENGRFAAYANFESSPNISAVPSACWLDWMKYHYKMDDVTYGNTLFMTFLLVDDPSNEDLIRLFYREMFLREPKLRFICTVSPPLDSIFDDILAVHCKEILSVDRSINRLSQSIFVCEKFHMIPKMRFRRALAEDNDDLIEIIDKDLPSVRQELGDFYIAESVLRKDESENIVVAEISLQTIGMIWVSTGINCEVLSDNFDTSAFGNFIKPKQGHEHEDRIVQGIVRKPTASFFDKRKTLPQEEITERSPSTASGGTYGLSSKSTKSTEQTCKPPSIGHKNSYASGMLRNKGLFEKWDGISKRIQKLLILLNPILYYSFVYRIVLKDPYNYRDQILVPVEIPKTAAVTNAFAIQLFGLSSTVDHRRIFDLVAAAFACYTDKDYCLISISQAIDTSSDSLGGPLLQYFSRVVPRPGSKLSDSVYVTHRNSFLSEIQVDYLTPEDGIELLAQNMLSQSPFKRPDVLHNMFDYIEDPLSNHDFLMIRSGGCPIGYVNLRPNCKMCELRTNYVLFDDEASFEDWKAAELMYLNLHPAFCWEWTHVVREIFRLTRYLSLHYRLSTEDNHSTGNSILLNMFPIFPRQRVSVPYKVFKRSKQPYALYYLNIKMAHLKRAEIGNRIVIIGFNESCNGFLRTLIFSPNFKHVHCLNITVITPNAGFIEAEYDTISFEEQHSMFFQAKNQFNADYLCRLEYRTWVIFIGAALKGIVGDQKYIILDNEKRLHYDRLFLMCSSRYGPPKPLKTIPMNYLQINRRLDKIIFYNKIRLLAEKIKDIDPPVLIYGTVLRAHSCVNALMDLGIKPTQIVLIAPMIEGRVHFPETFDDEHVKNFIYHIEEKIGIHIYKDFKFIEWFKRKDENIIESVIFESDFERIALKCMAFISFHRESLSDPLRKIMEASNIEIRDKKVVIDQNSRTNLPSVYACGRISQYKEELFARQIEQGFFNQLEVGHELAAHFVQERLSNKDLNMLDVQYNKPIFRQAQLADGLLFAGLRKPGKYVPREVRRNLYSYGTDLVTTDNNGEFCRILLDKNGFITDVTCLTRKYANLEVLYRLYDLHESTLNNLRTRYNSGEIEHLLDYVHKESFAVLVHDKFAHIKMNIRERNIKCLHEFLKNKDKVNKKEIVEYLKESGMDELIRSDITAFIEFHWQSIHPFYALSDDFNFAKI